MLTAHHISKSYGPDVILKDISLSIHAGERVGLIGPNGCGKTTFLRILAGEEHPDAGTVVHTRPHVNIGYLSQGFSLEPSVTIAEAFISTSSPDPESAVTELAAALAANPGDAGLQSAYDEALKALEGASVQPVKILAPLGLADLPKDRRVSELSGGQKTRLMLARLLLSQPNLLLLDEPTNHLDIEMLEWLEDWLSRYNGAALIVSHDRAFLDNTVSRILDLDPETHSIQEYSGNYSEYLQQFLAAREKQWETYRDQVAEIRRIKQDIARTKQQSLQVELSTTSRQPGVRRYAKKVAKKALGREKKLERFLESDELVERPKPAWQLKLEFAAPEHQSRDILVVEGLDIGYPRRAAGGSFRA